MTLKHYCVMTKKSPVAYSMASLIHLVVLIWCDPVLFHVVRCSRPIYISFPPSASPLNTAPLSHLFIYHYMPAHILPLPPASSFPGFCTAHRSTLAHLSLYHTSLPRSVFHTTHRTSLCTRTRTRTWVGFTVAFTCWTTAHLGLRTHTHGSLPLPVHCTGCTSRFLTHSSLPARHVVTFVVVVLYVVVVIQCCVVDHSFDLICCCWELLYCIIVIMCIIDIQCSKCW